MYICASVDSPSGFCYSHVGTATQWLLDLCNGIAKEGSIPRIGNQVWYCQSTKAKATLWSVNLTEGSNCWNMLRKL